MVVERNVEGLRTNAQRKRQEAFEKTDRAIQQLIKEGKSINFNTVEAAAGVSKAWLYKEQEVRGRIEQLRQQYSKKRSLPPAQRITDESKDSLIQTLKLRIKKQDEELKQLRKQVEVAYGRVLETEAIESQREKLEREVQQLRQSNDKLKQVQEELTQKLEAVSNLSSSDDAPLVAPAQKVTFINTKLGSRDLASNLQSELESLKKMGIRIGSKLNQKMAASPEPIVLDAIAALKQALEEGTTVIQNPQGWLSSAIDEAWVKNQRSAYLRCPQISLGAPSPSPTVMAISAQIEQETTTEEESTEELASAEELKALSRIFGE